MLQCTLMMISDWDTSVKEQLYQNVCQCYLGKKINKRIIFCFLQNKERKRFRCFVWSRSHELKKKHPVIYRHRVVDGGNRLRTIVGVVLFLWQVKKIEFIRVIKLRYETCWSVWNPFFFYRIPLEFIYFVFIFEEKKKKLLVSFRNTYTLNPYKTGKNDNTSLHNGSISKQFTEYSAFLQQIVMRSATTGGQ